MPWDMAVITGGETGNYSKSNCHIKRQGQEQMKLVLTKKISK